ncbi:MAG TPA: hypothetical protein PLO08_17850, partial [Alicycliphilus sp.]|nr:hypothetical protein [Alicycliphilus sp.]
MRQRGDGAHDELVFEPPDDLEPALQRFVVERAMGACARLLRDVLGSGLDRQDAEELAQSLAQAFEQLRLTAASDCQPLAHIGMTAFSADAQ